MSIKTAPESILKKPGNWRLTKIQKAWFWIVSDLSGKIDPEKYNTEGVVYQLIRKGKLVYIGQTTRLFSRISSHFADKEFDQVNVIFVPKSMTVLQCEGKLIFGYFPKYNQMVASGKKAHEWQRITRRARVKRFWRNHGLTTNMIIKFD